MIRDIINHKIALRLYRFASCTTSTYIATIMLIINMTISVPDIMPITSPKLRPREGFAELSVETVGELTYKIPALGVI